MKKKVSELWYPDLKRICEKYFHKVFNDSCEGCPLKVKEIYCVKGLAEEESNLLKKLSKVQELLKESLQMEIEVEEEHNDICNTCKLNNCCPLQHQPNLQCPHDDYEKRC